MYDIQSIYQATSVDDAIRALQADPSAIVIAGGTDVLIKIREGKLAGCSTATCWTTSCPPPWITRS